MPDTPSPPAPILIKRYTQSRFYDSDSDTYLTLSELQHWAENGVRFAVIDVDTGHDVTQTLLA